MSRGTEEQASAKSRGERLQRSIVSRLDATVVDRCNQEMAMAGVTQPKISDIVVVLNLLLRECYLVFLHQVDLCPTATPPVSQLLKLSERCTAPYRGRELWLRTPAYYRRIESADTKPTDPHDGLLTKDATPWMRRTVALEVGSIDSLNATMTFAADQEPWVYCTSIPPTNEAERKELIERFPEYDAMTAIEDPTSFAVRLGIDFAFSVQKPIHVELSPLERWAYDQSSYSVPLWEGEHPIDKIVRVYHGPVVYEDQSGVLGSGEDVVDASMVPKGWFTKKTEFSGEREYRFAVSTLGKPRDDTFRLPISDEMRLLTAKA